MNVSYLLSVLDLYLMKEKDFKTVIQVNNIENVVKFEFSYSFDLNNKTFVKIPKELFFENIKCIIEKIQGNLEVEEETFLNINSKPMYTFLFRNKRKIVFINFLEEELHLIRNHFSNLTMDYKSLLVSDTKDTYYDKIKELPKTKLSYSFGFTSYLTLILTSVWFLDIFMISLFIFKLFIS